MKVLVNQNTHPYSYPAATIHGNRIMNFDVLQPSQAITLSTPTDAAMVSEFKVPKVEADGCLNSDPELRSLKRLKFTDDGGNVQTFSTTGKEMMNIPVIASQAIVEQDFSDHVEDVSMVSREPSATMFMSQLSILNEPSPLGLNLRKSPSLLDLIQRQLAQHEDEGADGCDQGGKINRSSNITPCDKDKLKAANFPASKLRIGTWECTSRYDGDLVAKCYYAKRKLVWEILDSSLKSKMELQWSDISGLKASFPEDQPAILDIELSRPPLFFREINPQPRKHTLWQSTSDFTDGQATICRHHSVQFPVGVLNRHFEKLLQCDFRLKALNERNCIIVDSCFFDNRNMQIDGQHMLHYLPDYPSLEPLARCRSTDDNDNLQHATLSNIDSLESRYTIHGLQNDSQTRHHMVENVRRGFILEGFKAEPGPQTLHKHNDIGGPPGIWHHQGSYSSQYSSASPSSVIDTRGSNECSSSSETEEVSRKENLPSNQVKFYDAEEDIRQFASLKTDVCLGANKWLSSSHSKERAITWEMENVVSPIIQASEKQALNALSLHLLGEPMGPTADLTFLSGRNDEVHEQVLDPGRFSTVEDSKLHSQARDSCWNSMEERRGFETRPSSLPSHGSYVDLVYIPRIASQPQFLERGQLH